MARPKNKNRVALKEAVLPKTDIPVTDAKEPVEVVQENDEVNGQENLFPTVEEAAKEFKEVDKPGPNKTRKLIEELEADGQSVVYPSNEEDWNEELYQRLSKLKG